MFILSNRTDGHVRVAEEKEMDKKENNAMQKSQIIMSGTMMKISSIVVLLLLYSVNPTEASAQNDFAQFLKGMGDKISQTANNVKDFLLELFYRFRAFFLGHSQSTHEQMSAKGCGYAADDQPHIYNKNKPIVAKIKGGDDAIWHTW